MWCVLPGALRPISAGAVGTPVLKPGPRRCAPDLARSPAALRSSPRASGHTVVRKPEVDVSAGPDEFVALIVRHVKSAETDAEASGRVRVAVGAAVSASDATQLAPADAVEAEAWTPTPLPDAAAEGALPIGMEAPGWLTAMVAAVTARATASK